MYSVSVEVGFSAVHSVKLRDGTFESQHGHEWRVRVYFMRADVDETGMVVDFQDARSALESVTAKLHHTDLNEHAGLGGRNPTAEVVARYIFERLAELGLSTIQRVETTEAPGCVASYEPAGPNVDAAQTHGLTMINPVRTMITGKKE